MILVKACYLILLLTLSSCHCWLFQQRPAHDMNRNELRGLYNQNVQSLQRIGRPLDMPGGGLLDKIGIRHEGVIVRTNQGSYLVHKGNGFGFRGGDTVVTNTRHMSNKWTNIGKPVNARPGTNVGDVVKAGGTRYNLIQDNCMHAAGRMCKLG